MGNPGQLPAEALTPLEVTIALAVETESSPAAAEAAKGSARLENRREASAKVDSRVKLAPKSVGRGVRKPDLFAEKSKARVEKLAEKLVDLQVLGPVLQSVQPVSSSDLARFSVELQAIGSVPGVKQVGHGESEPPSRGGSEVSPGDAAGERAGERE